MTKAPLYNVPVGSRLILDGRNWLVTGREERGYAVECFEDAGSLTLGFDRVDAALRERTCEIIRPADAERRAALLAHTGGFEHFEQIPEERRRDVRCRLALVLAMDALEAEGWQLTQRAISTGGVYRSDLLERASEFYKAGKIGDCKRGGRTKLKHQAPQGRTLFKYRDVYRQFGANPVALVDREHLKGYRTPRMCALQNRFIDYVTNLWLDARKPKLAPLVRTAQSVFDVPPTDRAAGFQFPSITTIRERIKLLSETAKSIGRSGRRHAWNRKGAGATDIRALRFGERVEVDQVYLSLFTAPDGQIQARRIDPEEVPEALEENEIRRLWLHVMIDVATRNVLAWIVSNTADADHTQALLRMATRDKSREASRYGCRKDPAPAVRIGVHSADNGTATRNAAVYASQLGLRMTPTTGRAYRSTDKPYVESLFGTMQWQVLNFLPGYTGSRPGELEAYDPKGSAGITHDAIYGTLTRYFVDEYAHMPHRGTGMFGATPWEKLQEALATYGGLEAPSQRERCLHLGVKSHASTTTEGALAFKLPYNSTALQKFAAGESKRVTVHIDPDDLRKAVVTAEGMAEAIEVDLSMTALQDLTLEEATDLMEDACRRNPKAQELHDSHLAEVRAQRARDSSFFQDSRDPSNYKTIDKIRRQADRLANVSFRPRGGTGPTVPPGQVTDRSARQGVFAVRKSHTSGPDAPPSGPTFKPIKDSKL